MKKVLTILAILAAVGCTNSTDNTGKETQFGYNVMTVNECQYVIYVNQRAATMVHAGNCSNPLHHSLK